ARFDGTISFAVLVLSAGSSGVPEDSVPLVNRTVPSGKNVGALPAALGDRQANGIIPSFHKLDAWFRPDHASK
ncbi:MAG TPA: hypothetical protein VFA54_01970, partial [Bryobacterales bacterium]|nr:hypothetical protein [Bryobacterales bacterium]